MCPTEQKNEKPLVVVLCVVILLCVKLGGVFGQCRVGFVSKLVCARRLAFAK
jgi:hypothetical protein